MTERVSFPVEGLSFEISGLKNGLQLAYVSKRSRRKGRIDKDLLMVYTLEAGILEPRLTQQGVLNLMCDHPEVALHLAVRIAELTTG